MKWADVYVSFDAYEEVRVGAVLYYKGERFEMENVLAYADDSGDLIVPLEEKKRVQAEMKARYASRTGIVADVIEVTR